MSFVGGAADRAREYDKAETERAQRLAEIKAKRQDELLKTRWTESKKKYETHKEQHDKVAEYGGVDTLQAQIYLGGHKSAKDYWDVREASGDAWKPYILSELGEEPTLKYSDEDAMYKSLLKTQGTTAGQIFEALGGPKREQQEAVVTEEQLGSTDTYRRGKNIPISEEQLKTMGAWERPTEAKKSNKRLIADELIIEYTENLDQYPKLKEYVSSLPLEDRLDKIKAIATSVAYTQDVSAGMPYDKLQQTLFDAQRDIGKVVTASPTTPGVDKTQVSADSTTAAGSKLEQLENEVIRQKELLQHPDLKISTPAKKALTEAQTKLDDFKKILAKNEVRISDKVKAVGLEKATNRDQGSYMYNATISASEVIGDGDYFYDVVGTKGKKKKQLSPLGKSYASALETGIREAANTLVEQARADEVLNVNKLDAIDWNNITNIAKKDLAGRTFEFDAGAWGSANSAYVIPYNVIPFGAKITDEMRVRYESGLLKYVKEVEPNVARDATLGDVSARYYTLQTQGANATVTPMSDTTETTAETSTEDVSNAVQLMSDTTEAPSSQSSPPDIQFTVKDGVKGILGRNSKGEAKFISFEDKNKTYYEMLGLGYLFKPELDDVPRLDGDPRDNEWKQSEEVEEPTMIEDVSDWLGDASDQLMKALPAIPAANAAKLPAIISTYLRTGQVPAQFAMAGGKFGRVLDRLGITKHPMAQKIVDGKFGNLYGSRKTQVADKIKGSTTGKTAQAVGDRGKKRVLSATTRLKQRAKSKASNVKNKVKNTGDSILNKTTGTNKPGYPINNPAKSRLEQYTDTTSKIK